MTSTARVEANRHNAKRSTGPKSEGGKAKSRWNALRHGLRAEHAVIPTENKAEFAAHLRAWVDDWKPPTQARLLLVERAATASWRLRRCVRVESARLSGRVYEAYGKWDESQERVVRTAATKLHDEPTESVAIMESYRAGVARLIRIWETIADALSGPGGWVDEFRHHRDFVALLTAACDEGEELDNDVDASWRLLLRDNRSTLNPYKDVPLDDEEAERYRLEFLEIARGNVGDYAAMLEGMSEDTPARRRYAEVEATTPRPEDAASLRYEAHFDRQARACIAQLARLEQTGADLVGFEAEGGEAESPPGRELDPPPRPSPARGEGDVVDSDHEAGSEVIPPVVVGGPAAEAIPTDAEAEAQDEPDAEAGAPNDPNGDGPDGRVGKAGRDRRGRAWPGSEAVGATPGPRS